MKKFIRTLVPVLLAVVIVFSIFWYLFSYDRDFTRDTLLSQARYNDTNGNTRLSSWFYNLAYSFSGSDDNVAIELANQYKADGNYTKAEATLNRALSDEPSVELYVALCRAYVEQDKLLDAVNLLSHVGDPAIKAQLEEMRPTAPEADFAPGFYAQYISVSLTSSHGVLFCTTDGDYPSIEDPSYTEPITMVSGENTIYAISVAPNGLVSPLTKLGYTVGGVIEPALFTDANMEAAVRELLEVSASYEIYTNELWGITEFTLPAEVTSLEDLKLLPYLLTLNITDHNLDSLEGLAELNRLETLNLSGSRFPTGSLEILTQIPTLRNLTLSNCGLSTIADLREVRGLVMLDLSDNTLRDLEPISAITTLEELYLQENALITLEALTALSNLTHLNVFHNSLTTLEALASCPKLTWLDASTNQLTDLRGLENMGMLTYLSVEYNQLTDISPLASCPEITELSLSNNYVTDLTPIESMLKLDILDFSYNQAEQLPQWRQGCALRVIDGSYNKLTDIDNLAGLENISYVYMDYNEIASVDALADCYRLVQVNVYGTKVKDVAALTEHNIIVNYDPT